MKVKTALDSIGALQELSNLKFKNGAISFRIGKFLNELQPLVNLAIDKQKEIVKDNPPEKLDELFEPILNEEIEIKIPEIKLSDFQKGDDWLELSPGAYSMLQWLIVDDLA